MNATAKFITGGVFIAGTAAYLMVSAIKETGQFYLTPGELRAKVAADSAFRRVGVRVGARVVPGSIKRDSGGREVAFQASFDNVTLAVLHRGTIPDTFMDNADVVVEGKLDASGTFESKVLLAKCASRMEEMPEKYKGAPTSTKTSPGAP